MTPVNTDTPPCGMFQAKPQAACLWWVGASVVRGGLAGWECGISVGFHNLILINSLNCELL